MLDMTRKKLEMFARVRTFSRTHESADSGYATVVARFEERLAVAEGLAARQHEGLVLSKKANHRREGLRRAVHFQLLRYLVKVAGIAARTRPELAGGFRLPDTHASNREFLTSVRSMLHLAESEQEAMLHAGMSPTLLAELARVVAELEEAVETARATRLDRIGAGAELEKVTAELMELVQVLDGINRWRFGVAPTLLVEWNAAKQLPRRRPDREGESPAA